MKYLLSFILLLHCYSSQSESTDGQEESSQNEALLSRVRRGGLSMLRLGRGLQMLRLGKRAMPMLRLGRSGDTYSPDEIRLLLASLLSEERGIRQAPLPRYGKGLEFQRWLDSVLEGNDLAHERRSWGGPYEHNDETPLLISPGPRPGYRIKRSAPDALYKSMDNDAGYEKEAAKENGLRTVPLPRIGKSPKDKNRAIPLPRFGRPVYDEERNFNELAQNEGYSEKRAMAMLRLGRGMKMLRLGKRPFKMLRLGRSDEASNMEDDKRAMKMLRLGKRPFKMLRLGKRTNNDETAEKRSLRMMRLGKRTSAIDSDSPEVERRAMKMLRLGRSQ